MEFNNTIYADGGVMLNLDIGGAVNRCRQLGFADENIILDIIKTSGKTLSTWNYIYLNAFESLLRFW